MQIAVDVNLDTDPFIDSTEELFESWNAENNP
jgi:hypothetical protein